MLLNIRQKIKNILNNYSKQNIILGFKKAYSISFLPPKVEYYHNLLLIRIFRVIGGICIILTLTGKYTLILEQLQILVFIITFIHITLIIIIQIIKVVYGLYILIKKPELFEVRNSPLNVYGTHIAILLACAKFGCKIVGAGIVALAGIVSIDSFLEATGREKVFLPTMAKLMLSNINNISNFFNEINKSGNNLISYFNLIWDFDIKKIYHFLDTLTFQQEGALFHIVLLLTIMIIVWNILAIFFGNELIKYFNLEQKYPKLNKFFKLRTNLQRYYLMWNIFLLFVLCIFAIGINILVFIAG